MRKSRIPVPMTINTSAICSDLSTVFWAAFRTAASEDLVLGGVGGRVKIERGRERMAVSKWPRGVIRRRASEKRDSSTGQREDGVDEPHSPLRENTGSSFLPRVCLGITQLAGIPSIPTSGFHWKNTKSIFISSSVRQYMRHISLT